MLRFVIFFSPRICLRLPYWSSYIYTHEWKYNIKNKLYEEEEKPEDPQIIKPAVLTNDWFSSISTLLIDFIITSFSQKENVATTEEKWHQIIEISQQGYKHQRYICPCVFYTVDFKSINEDIFEASIRKTIDRNILFVGRYSDSFFSTCRLSTASCTAFNKRATTFVVVIDHISSATCTCRKVWNKTTRSIG